MMPRDHRTSLFFFAMIAVLLLSACSAVKPPAAGTPQPGASEAQAGSAPAVQPRWMTTGDALGVQPDAGREERVAEYLSTDPARLRDQLAVHCSEAADARDAGFLPVLIAEINRAGIDPAVATEALLKANCGSLSEVVQGLVAEGGEAALVPVVERATFLAGPGAEGIIESAASAGLGRGLAGTGGPGRSGAGDSGGSLAYSLAYFPARGGSVASGGLGSPYGPGMPGYGIYTFVLLGAGDAEMEDGDRERYRELLRVVQSYVLAVEEGTLGPASARHAFVVPVRPRGRGESLVQQADPALSTNMRDALAKYFDQTGHPLLSRRLVDHPGPFLLSSLEPRLVPSRTKAPRMLTDLSDVGAEYMYAVIDAYDRRIPDRMVGQAASFEPIRERLVELFALAAEPRTAGRLDDQARVQVTGVSTPTPRTAAESSN